MKDALEWLERKMDYIMIAIMIITLVVALTVLAAAAVGAIGEIKGNTEEQKETIIAEIALPDGSIVSGEVENYRSSGYYAWEITINGITYKTGKENVVIIKGGAGIQEE